VRLHDRVERLDRCGRAARAPTHYADLDGSLLLAEDQYDGIEMGGGEIRLGDQSGRGPAPARARSSSASVPLFVGVDLGLL